MRNSVKRVVSFVLSMVLLLSLFPVNMVLTASAVSQDVLTVNEHRSTQYTAKGSGVPFYHVHYLGSARISGVADNRVTYCLDRNQLISSSQPRNDSNIDDLTYSEYWRSLTDKQKLFIKRALLYGYSGIDSSNSNYTESAWRAATQAVLWDLTERSINDNSNDAGFHLFTDNDPQDGTFRTVAQLSSMSSYSAYKTADSSTKSEYEWMVGAINNHSVVPKYNNVAGSNSGANNPNLTYSQITTTSYVDTINSTGARTYTDSTNATKYLMSGTTGLRVIYEDSRDAVADPGNSNGNVGAVNVWHDSGSNSIRINVLRPMYGSFAIRISKGPADAGQNTMHLQWHNLYDYGGIQGGGRVQNTAFGHAADPFYAYYKFRVVANEITVEKKYTNNVASIHKWYASHSFAITKTQNNANSAFANMQIKSATIQGTTNNKYITIDYSVSANPASGKAFYVWSVHGDTGCPLRFEVIDDDVDNKVKIYASDTYFPVGSTIYYTISSWNPHATGNWQGTLSFIDGTNHKVTFSNLDSNTTYYIVEPPTKGFGGGVKSVTTGSNTTVGTDFVNDKQKIIVTKTVDGSTAHRNYWSFTLFTSESTANSLLSSFTQSEKTVQTNGYIDITTQAEANRTYAVYDKDGYPVSFSWDSSASKVKVSGVSAGDTVTVVRSNTTKTADTKLISSGTAEWPDLNPNTTFYLVEAPGPAYNGKVLPVTTGAANANPTVLASTNVSVDNERVTADLTVTKAFTNNVASGNKWYPYWSFAITDNQTNANSAYSHMVMGTATIQGTSTNKYIEVEYLTSSHTYNPNMYVWGVFGATGCPLGFSVVSSSTTRLNISAGDLYPVGTTVYYTASSWNPHHSTNFVGFASTDANGKAVFQNIDMNKTYYLIEPKGPGWDGGVKEIQVGSTATVGVTATNNRARLEVNKHLSGSATEGFSTSNWSFAVTADQTLANTLFSSFETMTDIVDGGNANTYAYFTPEVDRDKVFAIYTTDGKPIDFANQSDSNRILVYGVAAGTQLIVVYSTSINRSDSGLQFQQTDPDGVATFINLWPNTTYYIIEPPGPGWAGILTNTTTKSAPLDSSIVDATSTKDITNTRENSAITVIKNSSSDVSGNHRKYWGVVLLNENAANSTTYDAFIGSLKLKYGTVTNVNGQYRLPLGLGVANKGGYVYAVYDEDGYPINYTLATGSDDFVLVDSTYNGKTLSFVYSNTIRWAVYNSGSGFWTYNTKLILGHTGVSGLGTSSNDTYGVKFNGLPIDTEYCLIEIPGPGWEPKHSTVTSGTYGTTISGGGFTNSKKPNKIEVTKVLGEATQASSNATVRYWSFFLMPYSTSDEIASATSFQNSFKIVQFEKASGVTTYTIPQASPIPTGTTNRGNYVYAVYNSLGKPITYTTNNGNGISGLPATAGTYYYVVGNRDRLGDTCTFAKSDANGVATFSSCYGHPLEVGKTYRVIEVPGPNWEVRSASVTVGSTTEFYDMTGSTTVTNDQGYITMNKTSSNLGSAAGFKFYITDGSGNNFYGKSVGDGTTCNIVRQNNANYNATHVDGEKFFGFSNGIARIREQVQVINGVSTKLTSVTITETTINGQTYSTTYSDDDIKQETISGVKYYYVDHEFTHLNSGATATITFGNSPKPGSVRLYKYALSQDGIHVLNNIADGFGFKVTTYAGSTSPSNQSGDRYFISAQGSRENASNLYPASSDLEYAQISNSPEITDLYNGTYDIFEDVSYGPASVYHLSPTKIVVEQRNASGTIISTNVYNISDFAMQASNGHTFIGVPGINLTTLNSGGSVDIHIYNYQETGRAKIRKEMQDGSNVKGEFKFSVDYKLPGTTVWSTVKDPVIITGDGTTSYKEVYISILDSEEIPLGTQVRVTELDTNPDVILDTNNPQTYTIMNKGVTYSFTFRNKWKPTSLKVVKTLENASTGDLYNDTVQGWVFLLLNDTGRVPTVTLESATVGRGGFLTIPNGATYNFVYNVYNEYGVPISYSGSETTISVGTQYANKTVYLAIGNVNKSEVRYGATDANGEYVFENLHQNTTYRILEVIAPNMIETPSIITWTSGQAGTVGGVPITNTRKNTMMNVQKVYTSDSATTENSSLTWNFVAYPKSAGKNTSNQYYNVLETTLNINESQVTFEDIGLPSNVIVDSVYLNGETTGILVNAGYIRFISIPHQGSYLWVTYHYNTANAVEPTTITGSFTTSQGVAVDLTNVPNGAYWIEEIPQPGFKHIARTDFVVDGVNDVSVSFSGSRANDNHGLLSLLKKDANNNPLGNIPFLVSKHEYSLSVEDMILTDDNYRGRWTATTFTPKSTPVIALYVNDTLVAFDCPIELSNGKVAGLSLKQGDRVYAIYADSNFGSSTVNSYVTDSNGKITENLVTGSYFVREVPNPLYSNSLSNYRWVAIKQSSSTVTFTNEASNEGGIPVHKGFLDASRATIQQYWWFVATDSKFDEATVIKLSVVDEKHATASNPFETATDVNWYEVFVVDETNENAPRYLRTLNKEDIIGVPGTSISNSTIRIAISGLSTEKFEGYTYYVLAIKSSTVKCWAHANSNYYAYLRGNLVVGTSYYVHEATFGEFLPQAPQRATAQRLEDGYVDEDYDVEFDKNVDKKDVSIKKEWKTSSDGVGGTVEGWKFIVLEDLDAPATGRLMNRVTITYSDKEASGYNLKAIAEAVNGDTPYAVYSIEWGESATYDAYNSSNFSYNRTTGILSLTDELPYNGNSFITVTYIVDQGAKTLLSADYASVIKVTDSEGLIVDQQNIGTVLYIEEVPQYGYKIQPTVRYTVTSESDQVVSIKNEKEQTSLKVTKRFKGYIEDSDRPSDWKFIVTLDSQAPVVIKKQVTLSSPGTTLSFTDSQNAIKFVAYVEDSGGYEVPFSTPTDYVSTNTVNVVATNTLQKGTYYVYYVAVNEHFEVCGSPANGSNYFETSLANINHDYWVIEIPKYGWVNKEAQQVSVKAGNNYSYSAGYAGNALDSNENERETFVEIFKKDSNGNPMAAYFYLTEESTYEQHAWNGLENGATSVRYVSTYGSTEWTGKSLDLRNIPGYDMQDILDSGTYLYVYGMYINGQELLTSDFSVSGYVITLGNHITVSNGDIVTVLYSTEDMHYYNYAGYTGNAEGKILIKMPLDANQSVKFYVEEDHIYNYKYFEPQVVTVNQGGHYVLRYNNIPELGDFSLTKLYTNPILNSTLPESSAEFVIYPEVYGSYANVPSTWFNMYGSCVIDNLEEDGSMPEPYVLPYGRYIVEQTNGIDGAMFTAPFVIEVSSSNAHVDIEKVNKPYPCGELYVHKVDSYGRPMSGITFKLEYSVSKNSTGDFIWLPIRSLDYSTYNPGTDGMYPIGTTTTQGVIDGCLISTNLGTAIFTGLDSTSVVQYTTGQSGHVRYRLTEIATTDGSSLLASVIWEGTLPTEHVYQTNSSSYTSWVHAYGDYYNIGDVASEEYDPNAGAIVYTNSEDGTTNVSIYKHRFDVVNNSVVRIPNTGAHGITTMVSLGACGISVITVLLYFMLKRKRNYNLSA